MCMGGDVVSEWMHTDRREVECNCIWWGLCLTGLFLELIGQDNLPWFLESSRKLSLPLWPDLTAGGLCVSRRRAERLNNWNNYLFILSSRLHASDWSLRGHLLLIITTVFTHTYLFNTLVLSCVLCGASGRSRSLTMQTAKSVPPAPARSRRTACPPAPPYPRSTPCRSGTERPAQPCRTEQVGLCCGVGVFNMCLNNASIYIFFECIMCQ